MFIEKTANVMIAGGSMASVYYGLTPDQWQVVGILSGIGIGVAGVVVKAVVDIYFKSEHLKLAKERAAVLEGASGEL